MIDQLISLWPVAAIAMSACATAAYVGRRGGFEFDYHIRIKIGKNDGK